MAYDEQLANRIRDVFAKHLNVEEKKMFGGLCFMVSKHMCCGIVGDRLMARVGPGNYDASLKRKHVSKMDFTGKPMKGMVYVDANGLRTNSELKSWLDLCLDFVSSLPAKK